jgi:hypothetical protein
MRKYAKIIAILAIAVFLQGTMLNAAPLVWCVAGDDHRAIEFGISDDWHGHDQYSHVTVSGEELAMPVGPDGHTNDCLDDELLGPMASSVAKVSVFVPTASQLPDWMATSVQYWGDAPRLASVIRTPPDWGWRVADPAFLSTTKLLI